MIIDADLTPDPAAVELAEPEDCRRFHVTARGGDLEALGAALAAAGVGRMAPSGEALIDTAAVRRLAAGRVPERWEEDFAAMLAYAAGKGWLDDAGTAITAHVEWTG